MRTLVAGGRGMVGSNVAKLVAPCMVADLKEGYDLRERKQCKSVMKGVDRVYHLADRTVGIGYSQAHHGQMMTDSLLISLNLLEASREEGVKDYLYVSSSCVYNEGSEETREEDVLDSTPERVNEGYGWAKRIGELQCRYYAKEYGMRTVIVRPANIYGPSYDWSRPVEDMHVIPALIVKMLRGHKEITVWGNGSQTRTFQYEEDCARKIVAVMEKGGSGEAYNLGGDERSIFYVAQNIKELTRWNGKLVFSKSKPSGPKRKAQDASKINKLCSEGHRWPHGLSETIEAARSALS